MENKKTGFYSMINKPPRKYSNAGTKEIESYHREQGPTGADILVKDEVKQDWYAYIQSSANGCDIATIIKRFEATGQTDLLRARKNQELDVTGLPNNIIELKNKIDKIGEYFNALPNEIKEMYGHSINRFIANGCVIPQLKAPTTEETPEAPKKEIAKETGTDAKQ